MSEIERVRAVVAPVVEHHGLSLYDLERHGNLLRVTVEGPDGVDLDTIAAISRDASRALDADDPIHGAYTLEVSSPGIERRLRTAAHFAAALGERVKVKTRPGAEGERRADGIIESADDTSVVLRTDQDVRPIALADIERAQIVFEWDAGRKAAAT